MTFTQPIGHKEVQQQLAGLLAQGVFPHALLMYGPRGVGKATLAKWLAARLICGGADDGARNPLTPNKNCPQWAQLQAESCPDYYVLAPEEDKKSIGIKAVQSLLESLLRSADTARVVVIDAVDDLTPEAANTLLKTLEEPRAGQYFLLITHQLASVLPTIKSRCRLLRLGLLAPNESAAVLVAQGQDVEMGEGDPTQGAPGWYLNQTAAQRAAVKGMVRGVMPANTLPGLVPMMMHHVAGLPQSLKTAQVYKTLAEMQAKRI
jgi:DNA polymerase-3 subunit delta'